MKISQRNFIASQALYGLMIATKLKSSPSVLTALAYEYADLMLARGKKKKRPKIKSWGRLKTYL